VCVGDPGQIDPVITGDTSRWANSPTGPHVPAPFALQAAHPSIVNTVALQYTWRLGPATTAMVQGRFYPGLPFTSRRPDEHLSKRGQVLPELTHRTLRVANGATDGALIRAAVERVHELIDDTDLTTEAGTRNLTEDDVAVVVPHVPQAAAVRAMLSQYPGVLVGTADALQGLERAAVVAVHPLAGKRNVRRIYLDCRASVRYAAAATQAGGGVWRSEFERSRRHAPRRSAMPCCRSTSGDVRARPRRGPGGNTPRCAGRTSTRRAAPPARQTGRLPCHAAARTAAACAGRDAARALHSPARGAAGP